jgi:hypothetical protein
MNAPPLAKAAPPVFVGVDPGSAESAFSVIRPLPGARFAVVKAWMVEADWRAEYAALVEAQRFGRVACVGIELGKVIFRLQAMAKVMEAQDVGGRIEGVTAMAGLSFVRAQTSVWRARVLGARKTGPRMPKGAPKPKGASAAGDKHVARFLSRVVAGTESFDGSTHLFDATGVAVYAAYDALYGANSTLSARRTA